ncbi:hypothetical protein TNCV_2311781 [Trichonephila clavipes]|nr:hypothetical protein TNCV_2311781 [Trichonephila clavipes]
MEARFASHMPSNCTEGTEGNLSLSRTLTKPRPQLSTSHQLLRVVEYAKSGFKENKCTGAVFLDIQKAFDRFTDTVRAAHSHASRPIETLRKSFTPHHIHKLIRQKNQFRNLYHRTLDPHYKTLYNRAQKNVKKELKNYTNENWTARLQALNTQDNSLWAVQKFFKNKRSDIPSLHCTTGTAITDKQKADILAESILNNFTENERQNNDFDDDDEIVNNTVNAFLSHPPPPTAETAYPSEIISYIKSSNPKKAPGSSQGYAFKHENIRCGVAQGSLLGPLLLTCTSTTYQITRLQNSTCSQTTQPCTQHIEESAQSHMHLINTLNYLRNITTSGKSALMLKNPLPTFPQRLAQPISFLLLASMTIIWSDQHKYTGYGMEARFASHMPSNCTEGTEGHIHRSGRRKEGKEPVRRPLPSLAAQHF